jgi:type IV secretion system protein VirB10
MDTKFERDNPTGREGEGTIARDNERGIPQVGRKRKGNKWLLLLGLSAAVVLMIAVGVRSVLERVKNRAIAQRKEAVAERGLPSLTRDAFNSRNAPLPPPPPPAETADKPATPDKRAGQDLAERRKRAPLLSGGGSSSSMGSGGVTTGVTVGATAGPGYGSPLGSALSATRAAEVSARQLTDPNLTITQGSFLDCNLITAINSTQPGMTSCVLARNIYSTNGRVLLLERGSRLVGQYQSAQLRQGMDRIFVLWTRAETPNGIVVNLDSPSTDALGRSGLDGKINNHFWARFGSALLVSVVNDASQAAVANQRKNGSGSTISFNSTAGSANDAAAIIVQNTVNIPPTLDKAQGSHIGIFVARDLYFGSVYSLAPQEGSQ